MAFTVWFAHILDLLWFLSNVTMGSDIHCTGSHAAAARPAARCRGAAPAPPSP
jgi:hypothetical protein